MTNKIPNSKFQIPNSQSGQIILITLVFMAIVTTVVVSLVGYTGVQTKAHRQALAREQGLNIAEAGAELAVWKLNNQPGYSGESNIVYGNGIFTVTISDISGSSKLVKVESYVPNASNPMAHRIVQMTVKTGSTTVAFNYGVQVGNGGLDMYNSSRIIGNVYSNDNITGHNSARISGTAVAAGQKAISSMRVDGNANAYMITNSTVGGSTYSSRLQNSTVGGNVEAYLIQNCTIGGNAIYSTKSSCTIGGNQTTPNPNNWVGSLTQNMPISDEQIEQWQDEAAAGGEVGSQSFSSGTSNLGPVKINGNLTLSNSAVVNITGTIWVTGQVSLSNSSKLQLDESYGSQSGVMIAGIQGSTTAGYIELGNSAQVQGSGTAGSYLMLLSLRDYPSADAIRVSNSGSSVILYAPEGVIRISNSAALREITAWKLVTENSATVTYESGLANPQFSSGASGGWEISPQSWQLLQ